MINNAEKSAEAIHLEYVNDGQPGIHRTRKGRGFTYTFDNRKITDKDILLRIKQLVIPPAWERVWICEKPDGHLPVSPE